jgi:hypothetical protein
LSEAQYNQTQERALDAIRALKNDHERVAVLETVAPHLLGPHLAEAFIVARQLKYDAFRAKALAALAPRLNGRARATVLDEALVAVRATGDEGLDLPNEALEAMAPHLRGAQLKTALAAAREIPNEGGARALCALAQQLSGKSKMAVLNEMLAQSTLLPNEYSRAYALTKLAPHLGYATKPRRPC